MKKNIYLLLLIFLSASNFGLSQTCSGTLYFSAQSDVDQFLVDNPTCTSIDGNVYISLGVGGSSNRISNVDGFQNIQSISGTLEIGNHGFDFYTISFTGFSALQEVGTLFFSDLCSTPTITSLVGFENLNTINALYLRGLNALSNIDVFDNLSNIEWIELSGCNSIDFTDVFPSVTSLSQGFYLYDMEIDHFTGFNALTSAGNIQMGETSFYTNVTHFDAFNNLSSVPNIRFYWFYMETFHGFESVQSAEAVYLDISTLHSFDAFSSLTNTSQLTLYGYTVAPLSIVFESLHSAYIEILDGSYFTDYSFPVLESCNTLALTTLHSFDAPNLNLITGNFYVYSCDFTSLDFLSNVTAILGNVEITYNYLLSDCYAQALCDKLNVSAEMVTISDNLTGCNSNIEVADNCAFSYATGTVFLDADCDGIFNNQDVVLPNPIIHNENDLPIGTSYSDGAYLIVLDDNSTHTWTAVAPFGFSSSNSYTITTSSNDSAYTDLNFGLCSDANNHNVSVDLISSGSPRPGFNYYCLVHVQNHGGYQESVQVTMDISGFPGASVVDASGGVVSGNTITWNLSNIALLYSNLLEVTFHLNANVPLGTTYVGVANIELVPNTTVDLVPTDNSDTLNVIVIGSYDPNYKVVNRTAVEYAEYVDGSSLNLEYEIHFQNTGTAEAITVRLEDDFASYYDMSSFQMMAASHSYEVSFDGSHVEWLFNAINLPDSTTDQLGSQGFVKFRINTFGNHTVNDVIENDAAIYFDFNEPIITDIASTIFYECPTSPIISGPTEACAGEDLSFNATNDWTNYTWSIGGQSAGDASNLTMYNVQAGNYPLELITSTEFCNSTAMYDVTVNPIPAAPSITLSDNVLTASSTGTFNWTLNGVTIGDNTSILAITESGIYGVSVESNGCSSSTTSGSYQYVGIEELLDAQSMIISPNPMITSSVISFSGFDFSESDLVIFDATGRKIITQKIQSDKITLSNVDLKPGVYFVSIQTGGGILKNTQKLLVE